MTKKLKVPAGGLASESKPAEAPAESTVADQATAMLESSDETTSETVVDQMVDAFIATESTEPQIADADVPASPALAEGEPPAADTSAAAPDIAAADTSGTTDTSPPPAEQPTNTITQEQREAYSQALQNHWTRHSKWTCEVEGAKEKHTTAAIVRSQADDARKAAKADEDDALEELMDLLNNEPQEPKFADVVAELVRKRGLGAASDRPAAANQPAAPANTSDAWRTAPITGLDLPAKLIERLQEADLGTMGRLEDRRAEIALGREKWPKGIGTAKITKIEDAIIAWLTKNRDQTVFQDLQSAPSTDTAKPTNKRCQHGVPDGECSVCADFRENSGTDAEAYADAINARAATFDVDEPGALQDKLGAGYWDQGFKHYEAGGELRTCELPPSPAQDDFIRGWLAAGNVKRRDESAIEEEPPAGEEPELQEVGVGGPALFNPDDI